MAGNRRLLLLGATLIAAIIAVMVVRSGDGPPAPAAVAAPPRPAAQPSAKGEESNTAPDVKLAALERGRSEPTEQGRNPFRFRPKPVPPPPAPPPNLTASRMPGGVDGSGGPGAAPPATFGPPPPPPITLKFIGVVEKADGTRWAVLTDGKRPIHGKEGDEIEGRYKILKIGIESLEIAYIDGRGRRTLPLNGQ